MPAVLEFAPLVAFLVAYYAAGLYTATAILMVAMLLLLVVDFARTRKIPRMHALSTVLVFVFGTATLLLRDERFIQWKPTVFFWLVSAAFLGSQWIGEKPLVQRLLGTPLGELGARIPVGVWRGLNASWAVFYAILGAANILVALNASERFWVNFKVFGLTAATLLFVVLQLFWLARRYGDESSAVPPAATAPEREQSP